MVVSIPALRNTLLDDPLKSTGRRLIGYVDGVREKAIREQQGYLLYIDLDDNSIRHLPGSEADSEDKEENLQPEQERFRPTGETTLRGVWQREAGTTARGIVEVWVSGQGYLEKTVIQLENDGEAMSLLVQSFLPEIEIRDGLYEPEQDEH